MAIPLNQKDLHPRHSCGLNATQHKTGCMRGKQAHVALDISQLATAPCCSNMHRIACSHMRTSSPPTLWQRHAAAIIATYPYILAGCKSASQNPHQEMAQPVRHTDGLHSAALLGCHRPSTTAQQPRQRQPSISVPLAHQACSMACACISGLVDQPLEDEVATAADNGTHTAAPQPMPCSQPA